MARAFAVPGPEPQKTIRFIVPFPAGGGTDFVAIAALVGLAANKPKRTPVPERYAWQAAVMVATRWHL